MDNQKNLLETKFELLSSYPPELIARFNSFITTEFDDSLTVEMQLRSIIKWASKNFSVVDDLIRFINDLTNFLKAFMNQFDVQLEETIITILTEWQESGKLDGVITDALQWQLDDYIDSNEEDKKETNERVELLLSRTSGTVSSSEYGIEGNGTDETVKFQELLNENVGKHIIMNPFDTFLKIGTIIIPSNTIIEFPYNSEVRIIEGLPLGQSMFDLTDKSNIIIKGNNTTFIMNKPEYIEGEHRHGFNMDGNSKNIYIHDLTIKGSGGDGFYVGNRGSNSQPNININLINCVADGNKRQGLSITNVRKFRAYNCVFKNTDGTSPQAGLDIEPNRISDYLEDIIFDYCYFINNKRAGIEIMLRELGGVSNPVSITFNNCYTMENLYGTYIRYIDHNVGGFIHFNNCQSLNERGCGYLEWNVMSKAMDIRVNLTVTNANSAGSESVEYGGASSFLIRNDGVYTSHSLTKFVNCGSFETRENKLVTRDFYLLSGNDSVMQAIIENPKYDNNLRIVGSEEKTNVGVIQPLIERDIVNYTKNTSSGYTLLGVSHVGKIMTNDGAEGSISFRLRKGQPYMTYEIRVTDGSQPLGIQSALGANVIGHENNILRGSGGARIVLQGTKNGTYMIVEQSGVWVSEVYSS